MFVAVDIGNTNITLGVFESEQLKAAYAFRTDSLKTIDDYYATISTVFLRDGLRFSDLKASAISSVVPALTSIFEGLLLRFTTTKPLVVGPGIKTGVPVKTANPAAVGADRIVNSVAVKEYYGTPAVVVDFGTATTFDYIDSTGSYCGGIISPGVGISLEALVSKTAKLPRIEIVWPEKVIGNDTVPAMRSGVVLGYACLVEGLLNKIKQEVPDLKFVVATGGLGKLFGKHIKLVNHYDEYLLLKGLYILHKMNND